MHSPAKFPTHLDFDRLMGAVEGIRADNIPEKVTSAFLKSVSDEDPEVTQGELAYLGLLAEDGVVLPPLQNLITDEDTRAIQIETIVRQKFGAQIRTGEDKNSGKADFDAHFWRQGVSNDETPVAAKFVIDAAKYAGIKLTKVPS